MTASPDALLRALQWRYAVKKFDASARIPAETWRALEEALVLTPSSFGLQPWRFVVVEDPALRARLKAASWGQSQVVDADKLVVFAARRDFGAADIERFVARTAAVRGAEVAALRPFKEMLEGALLSRPSDDLAGWAARQVYIALGNFLASAAVLGVDACPMEGIDPAQYDAILGLGAKGFRTVVAAAAGRRAADDGYAAARKVRYAAAEVVEHV